MERLCQLRSALCGLALWSSHWDYAVAVAAWVAVPREAAAMAEVATVAVAKVEHWVAAARVVRSEAAVRVEEVEMAETEAVARRGTSCLQTECQHPPRSCHCRCMQQQWSH